MNPCVDCVTQGCPWEEHYQPVDGWTATKVRLPTRWGGAPKKTVETYRIEFCPLFTPHPRQVEQKKTDNRGKRYTAKIEARNLETGETKIYQTAKETAADGFSVQQVRRVLSGMLGSHRGYVFTFREDG